MKKQELINAMSEILEKIKEVDSQKDTVDVLKGSKLGEMYIGCLSDKDIKDIYDKKAANAPVPSLNEITEMMIKKV